MSYSVKISNCQNIESEVQKMSSGSVPRNFRGTRDYFGADYALRAWATETIAGVFQRFGFQPLETPMIETEETLRGKYGQEGESNWFKLSLSSSDGNAGLRYDQTVPLARFMAVNWNQFPLPFRRYVIGPVFRKETVQAGRLRQFTQCDFDTVGTNNPIVDAEVVAMNATVLNRLGFRDEFVIQINDRRLLDAIAAQMGYTGEQVTALFRAWDKLGKQTLDEVNDYFAAELIKLRLDGETLTPEEWVKNMAAQKASNRNFVQQTEQLAGFEGLPADVKISLITQLFPSESVRTALDALDDLFGMVSGMGVDEQRYTFNPLMARGLDYYTGPIFETFVEGGTVSITGGGRFDKLIETLGGPDLPASGSSFGLERVLDVMQQYGIAPDLPVVPSQVFAVVFEGSRELKGYLFGAVTKLRLTGVNVEVYTGDARTKIGKQLDVARRKAVPLALIIGEDEMRNGTAQIKVLSTGEPIVLPLEQIPGLVESLLQQT